MMSQESTPKSPQPSESKNSRIEVWKIIATILGSLLICFATVVAAGIEPFAGWMVSLLPTKIVPTAVIPTETISPQPTKTDIPVSLPISYLPGQDWQNGCISNLWSPYPEKIAMDDEGCFFEPLPGQIFTKSGSLVVLAQNDVLSAKEYGIFIPVPQSGNIRLSVDLNHLENSELWVGIFSEPRLDMDGVLIVVPFSPPAPVRGQDTKQRAFAIRAMPLQTQKLLTKIYKDVDGIYQLGFDLTDGAVSVFTEGDFFDPIAMAYNDRWLFIGYRSLIRKSDIDVSFKDLIINEN